MGISPIQQMQTADFRPRADKIGLMAAQKTLEAARKNQESERTNRPAAPEKKFAHPYLGHNVDIYV